jgi:hypothetical protein
MPVGQAGGAGFLAALLAVAGVELLPLSADPAAAPLPRPSAGE